MYSNIKSCVKYQNHISEFFDCLEGLMQGESLSPFLFSLYVNDFEIEFIKEMCLPVEIRDIALFLIMYADDTVLFSETEQGLQNMLDCLQQYTSKWKLTVNVDKTKIVVFRKGGRLKNNYCWNYNNECIDIVENFNYLGITLNFNGSFHKTQSVLASQSRKAMYCLLSKMKPLQLNVNTKLSLFDTYIGSIVHYGCELWGQHPASELESIHLDFCKKLLCVKKSVTSMMVYFELGRKPLQLDRNYRMLKYWIKLKNSDNCILSNIYQDMVNECETQLASYCWLSYIKQLINNLGFGYIWNCKEQFNEHLFLHEVKQRLTDMFIQEGHGYFENSPKCTMYKHLCYNFEVQEYLTKPIPTVYVQFISKYRLSSHQLEIERGRFYNIHRNERVCKLCSLSQIEDEFHFILICPFYKEIRKLYVKKYYYEKPSVFKLIQLLSTKNIKELCNLGKYLYKCSKLR